METKADPKKVPLNIYVRPDVKQAIEDYSEKEDRNPSNLADRLLGWCVKWLRAAGDSESLLKWQVRPAHSRSRRLSEETQEALYTALGTILERAPSAIVEETERFLSERAGKYGDDVIERSALGTSQPRRTKRSQGA